MWAWLFDGLVLYGFIATVPLLGFGCLVYYLLVWSVAVKDRPFTHKGMADRLWRLKMEQKENDALYQRKELDKLNQQWQDEAHTRLSPLELTGLAAFLLIAGWGLSYV